MKGAAKLKKISVVVSVYNEEEVLDKFFTKFLEIRPTLAWESELIFVNDGSVDKSLQMITGFAEENQWVKVISFSRNFGHEAAMLAGIDNAGGDAIICMDADLQHPLECITPIIEKFEEGYEVITMVRTSNVSAGRLKNVTSSAFYNVVNLLSSGVKFEKNVSDFFAINAQVAEVLRTNYREKNRFLRGFVQSIGFNKTALEYEASERAGGHSHYNIKKLIKFSVDTIICFSNFPLKIGIYAGIMAAFLGTVVLIYTLLTFRGAPSGYATIVILLCFLFSLLFVVIGIIGEYISVLFEESKNRPIYIVKEKINLGETSDSEERRC